MFCRVEERWKSVEKRTWGVIRRRLNSTTLLQGELAGDLISGQAFASGSGSDDSCRVCGVFGPRRSLDRFLPDHFARWQPFSAFANNLGSFSCMTTSWQLQWLLSARSNDGTRSGGPWPTAKLDSSGSIGGVTSKLLGRTSRAEKSGSCGSVFTPSRASAHPLAYLCIFRSSRLLYQ